jgi:hypothetical protein
MNSHISTTTLRPYLYLLGLAAALALLLTWPLASQAGNGLPPRQPPTPTPSQDKDDDDDDGSPPGAYIELAVTSPQAGLWSGVQWQDSRGGWHEVEGWQGSLSSGGSRRWWVAAKDFGTGPFRWLVRSRAGGPVVGASADFYLPQAVGETVRVAVDVGP